MDSSNSIQYISAAVFLSYSVKTAMKFGGSTVFLGPATCCLYNQ